MHVYKEKRILRSFSLLSDIGTKTLRSIASFGQVVVMENLLPLNGPVGQSQHEDFNYVFDIQVISKKLCFWFWFFSQHGHAAIRN